MLKSTLVIFGITLFSASALADWDLDIDFDAGVWKCHATDSHGRTFTSGYRSNRFKARIKALDKCWDRSNAPQSCEISDCRSYHL